MIYVGRRGASQRPLKLDNGSLLVHLWARNERPFFTLAPVLYNRCPSTIDTLDTLLSLISRAKEDHHSTVVTVKSCLRTMLSTL